MASIHDLPPEIILNITRTLVNERGREPPWAHVAAFVLTDRRHYAIANPFLYRLATHYHYPVLRIGELGTAESMQKLLQAGLTDPDTRSWVVDRLDFPYEYRVGRWAGRCRSVNSLSGVIDWLIQGRALDYHESVLCGRLRVSVPLMDRDSCFFSKDGTIKARDEDELCWLEEHTEFIQSQGPITRGNSHTRMSWSPLHAAAANGHVELIKTLLDAGADIDAPSKGFCWCRCLPTVEEVYDILEGGDRQGPMEVGSDKRHIVIENAPEWTPLHHAICHGQIKAAIYLLERGAWQFLTNLRISDCAVTALHVAAGAGCLELVTYLLQNDHRTGIDDRDDRGQTPLHWACRNGHFDTVVPWLIEQGADINTNLSETQSSLLLEYVDCDQFINAMKLIDAGADPNSRGPTGLTPLHLACYASDSPDHITVSKCSDTVSQRRQLVDKLIAAGADISVTGPISVNGEVELMEALEVACFCHNIDAIKSLLGARAKRSEPDPFECAKRCVGYCLDERDEKGSASCLKVLDLLITYASRLDKAPPIASIALELVTVGLDFAEAVLGTVQLADPVIVHALLLRGADPRGCTETSLSPFKLALDNGQLELCDMMLRRGFQPTSAEIEEFWHCGAVQGSCDILEYVLDINKYAELSEKLVIHATELSRILLEDHQEWEPERLEPFLLGRNLLDLRNDPVENLNLTLHNACLAMTPKLAKRLLEAGADPNSVPKRLQATTTPLLLVMSRRELAAINPVSFPASPTEKLLDVLLQNGADVLQPGTIPGLTIGNTLGNRKPIFDNDGEEYERTPMGYAILQHDVEALSIMLRYHPQILRKDSRALGRPYLKLPVVSSFSKPDIDRLVADLILQGADPAAKDGSGNTAVETVIFGLDNTDERLPLRRVWAHALPRLLRMLWHDNIDINRRDSPLRYRSLGEILDMVIQWYEKSSHIRFKNWAADFRKHFDLRSLGDRKYSVQLRPLDKSEL